MPALHLLFGPVGAGKSTFARELCRQHHAVRLTVDDWMAQLFGADERPTVGRLEWYMERRQRVLEQTWKLTLDLLAVGTPVVYEPGLIRRQEREALYARADEAGLKLAVYVLDAPREVRRERVLRRNGEQGETFAMEVPLAFFELASDLWEPPDDDERRERDIRLP